ncbi:MAG TPA: hypothetical protein VEV17_09715 [Bryobacteraceae bacterium]|nr:hypothetical protein [Bryobacteraceae bacterium]
MNRSSLLLLLFSSSLCLPAQTFSTITISTVPSGAQFSVDGQVYLSATTLVWPAGSSHVVAFVGSSGAQGSPDGTTQYGFTGWVDNRGLLISKDPVLVVTADPRVTTLTANLTVAYRVTVNFYAGNPNDPTLASCATPGVNLTGTLHPGMVFIGNACLWATGNVFVQANSTVPLNAFPFPGFAFTGWSLNGQQVSPFLASVTVKGPMTIAPGFVAAKRVHFLTSPLGFNLLIDHTQVPTRTINDLTNCPFNESQAVPGQIGITGLCFGDFDFAPGSAHVLGAVSPQRDSTSNWWVFDHWSNGTGANSIYTTDTNVANPDTLTAFFVPAASVSFVTNPSGLKLNVDGRENWPGYNFVWPINSTHQVTAMASQFDAKGRQYSFQNWSNGGAASQTVNVDQTAINNGLRIMANYSVLSRIVVQSVPIGLAVSVDGTSCQTPCTIDRQNGASLRVTAPTQVPVGAGARLDFASWSDGGASDHTLNVNQDYTTLTVSYTNSFQLTALSDPGNGVSFQTSPASNDMFFPQNAQVTITATPNPGFKFRRWNGDLAGSYPVGALNMSVPRSVLAQADPIPYIPPAGVGNAVGQTPTSAVAPGSIISISGQNLAPGFQAGPVNPLSQTIAGVAVTVNDSILGLVFVSPQQINAQLPSDLADGDYVLQVHSLGQPDVSGSFTVARNAPGLFFQVVNAQPYALALHADGSAVTPDSPAAADETISLLGTGFGPYASPVIDGFFPVDPVPALSDTLVITVADQTPAPIWAGAATGYTGLAVTQFQVPEGLPSGSNVPVKVNVNGVDSNTVMLPIQ